MLFFTDLVVFPESIFIRDLENAIEEKLKMAEENCESSLFDDLPPAYSETQQCRDKT